MPNEWEWSLIERLIAAANNDGAWGYQPNTLGRAEPTALAAVALAEHGVGLESRTAALAWLTAIQRPDGAVPVSAEQPSPCWSTAPALLAWLRAGPTMDQEHTSPVEKAAAWLLDDYGLTVPPDMRIFGHDTTLSGWAWSEGTHSFVEPTSMAILALRPAGHADHPHVREGVQVLLDRAFPTGGWNYGNTRVLDSVLRPFPATSGMALAALGGEPPDTRIDKGIAYLIRTLPGVRTPLSLGWGLIGLRAWDVLPGESETWLADAATRALKGPQNVLYDAVLLLAAAKFPGLSETTAEANHAEPCRST